MATEALRINSDFSITLRMNNISTVLTAIDALTINVWSHIIVTRAAGGGGAIKCYKDGVDITSGSPSNFNEFVATWIGRTDNERYWIGGIDNVAIYNKVLLPAEIAELYAYGMT